jgi:hypothetical protein
LLLLLACFHPLLADEETAPAPTPTPGFFHRIINVFHKDKAAEERAQKEKKLDLTLDFSPQPVKLSEGKEIQVTLVLTNRTGRFAQFTFPTTQRIEVLLRNHAGKLVTQWSEEQSFTNDPGYVTINPGEHVQYTVNISGRDLVPGQTYTIEGFFPNYENLRVTRDFVPQR